MGGEDEGRKPKETKPEDEKPPSAKTAPVTGKSNPSKKTTPSDKKATTTNSPVQEKKPSAKKMSATKKRRAEDDKADASAALLSLGAKKTSKKPRSATTSIKAMKETLAVAPAAAQAAYQMAYQIPPVGTTFPLPGQTAAGSMVASHQGLYPVVPSPKSRWSFKDFDMLYEKLKAFKAVNGHCRVPVHYAPDPMLAAWVRSLRRKYKDYQREPRSPHCSLTEKQIKKLDAIDFEWQGRRGRPAGTPNKKKQYQIMANNYPPKTVGPLPSTS